MSFWKLSVGDWVFASKRTRFFSFEEQFALKEIVRRISEIGLDGIDFLVTDANDWNGQRIAETRNLVKSAGLEVISVSPDIWSSWPFGSLVNPSRKERLRVIRHVKETAAIGKQLGARLLNVWPGSDSMISPKGESYWTIWDRFVKSVAECVDNASDEGLKVTVEYKLRDPAEFQILNNSDTFMRLAESIRSSKLGACLDTGHAIQCREHLPSVVNKLAKWLFHVHLDDNYGDWDDDLPPGYVHDFSQFFKALRMVNYRGYLMFDLFPLVDPFGEVRRSKEYVQTVCSRIRSGKTWLKRRR